MSSLVTEADIAAYDRDGAICLRNVVDYDWVERMREASLRLMHGGTARMRGGVDDSTGGPKFFSAAFLHESDPLFREFAMTSALPGVAAAIMRTPAVRLFYDQLFIKEPGTKSRTDWHNDLPYWPLRGNDIVSIWVALTPVDRESSGVEYVAGSHRWGRMFQALTPDRDPRFMDPTLEPAPDFSLPAEREAQKMLSWTMSAGDVLVHHPLTVHGAGGNATLKQPRIGLSIRYMGRDVQWDPRDYVMKLPVEPAVAAGDYPADDRAFPSVG